MKPARFALPTLALVIAIIGTAIVSALAATAHPICAARQHECGNTPSIRQCCCGDQSTGSDQSGPIPGKAVTGVSLVPIAEVFAPTVAPDAAGVLVRAQASPPRAAPVDFPTLFASLLI